MEAAQAWRFVAENPKEKIGGRDNLTRLGTLPRAFWRIHSDSDIPMQRGLLGAALSPPFVPKRLPRLPVAEAWVNSGKLTLAAVAAAHRGVMKIKRSPDPHFMYNEVGVVDRLPDKGGVGSRTEFVEMCPSKFVRAVESQDGVSPPFHYYTCGVMQHAPGFAEEVFSAAVVCLLTVSVRVKATLMWPILYRRVVAGSTSSSKRARLRIAMLHLPTPRSGSVDEDPRRRPTMTFFTMYLCRCVLVT